MAKIIKAKCRHCKYRFQPRVAYPRQCGNCWKSWPLGKKKNGERRSTR